LVGAAADLAVIADFVIVRALLAVEKDAVGPGAYRGGSVTLEVIKARLRPEDRANPTQ
jgi:hypothetical protein